MLGLQDSADGICPAVPGGTQGLQEPAADSDSARASPCCGFQTTRTESEWLLAFPQAEMVFDSP